MSETPKILWPALRQYRHNGDNSPDLFNPEQGFVAAFDRDETIKVVTTMQEEIAALRAKSARQTESFEAQWHLHSQATAVREDEIAALKAELDAAYKERTPWLSLCTESTSTRSRSGSRLITQQGLSVR